MKRSRVEKAFIECQRLMAAMSLMHAERVTSKGQPDYYDGPCPYVAAVKRASLDLTRALADMRKNRYVTLPGEK